MTAGFRGLLAHYPDKNAGTALQPHPPPAPEVDAVMMSQVSAQPNRPKGARYGSSDTGARTFPRIVITADTHQPPPGGERMRFATALRSGNSAFAKRGIRHTADARARAFDENRALIPGYVPRRRGWRLFDDNAHADRCAPPGRNPGGGAEGQPY
ncbi:hypothetical protein [Novosphingobium cyanobacteriorum]|uniref:Uncharacterized protein n=1 Tax=Novosphingobium cyanobacteriorum TaxID=3024215 RepID=A0ABT6CCE2_9SPHN|nr:hypothetical protein [Novosphingobium cyanobacteriorum]MDF8331597.1 hypothetical protein [Novosphingobium cyanobacteriorum]